MKLTNKTVFSIVTGIHILLILTCIYTLLYRGIDSIGQRDLMSISFDLFGMLVGFVLYICCMLDVQKTGADLKYFRYLLNVTFMGVFTDAIADLVDGIDHLMLVNLLNNTLHYMCTPVMLYLFWKYVSTVVQLDRSFERVIGQIIQYGMILLLVSHLINIFTGIYFTVDTNGVYSRSATFPLAMFFMVIGLGLITFTILTERKQLERFQLMTLLVYVLGAVAGIAVTVALRDVNVGNCESILVMLLMYCLLNIAQGREKVAADRELAMAAGIQASVLPTAFPDLHNREDFDLHAFMSPAREVGGDFYDFFMIDKDHLTIVIGDVAGKGVPASLFMMVARTMIKTEASRAAAAADPGTILSAVNDQLCEENDSDMFVTVWLGILDLSSGEVRYSRAGHEYPALSAAGRPFILFKNRSSLPLGSMEGVPYRTEKLILAPGDKLFLYTDGVPEATNAAKQLFGTDRMLEALNRGTAASAREINRTMQTGIEAFVKEARQFDDITMLSLIYHGKQ